MPTRSCDWIWCFAVILILALGGTIWLVTFNLQLQLSREQLTAAYELWNARKPADYDLVYTIKKDDEKTGLAYTVRVRDGKLVSVLEEGVEVSSDRAGQFTMEGIFERMRKNLEHDAQPDAPKVYARARFHDQNGAVLEYVRRLMGTRDRIEIAVKRFRFGPDLNQE